MRVVRAFAAAFILLVIYSCALATTIWALDPYRLAAVKQEKERLSYCPPDPRDCD